MKDYVEQRLKELREEMEIGQKQLSKLEARSAELRNTLLRISGAVQALEEVLAHGQQRSPTHSPPAASTHREAS